MRSLIRKVLDGVAADGLPGQHHFFITFDTLHPDVDIAGWLTERYPGDMTIVVQHWFDNLDVTDAGFGITLNFGDNPERLYIPYDAIVTFVDPSVEFGLRFEGQDGEDDEAGLHEVQDEDAASPVVELLEDVTGPDDDDAPPQGDAEIVSLDSFRKK
jgi:hypothetical protein